MPDENGNNPFGAPRPALELVSNRTGVTRWNWTDRFHVRDSETERTLCGRLLDDPDNVRVDPRGAEAILGEFSAAYEVCKVCRAKFLREESPTNRP
jgi:hypothetical protein